MRRSLPHLVVLGAGGNIGSHLVPHLARMPGIEGMTLIDRDVYELRNVEDQDINGDAVGRHKAVVQAERARAIRPTLGVDAVVADLESVPLGAFRGAVLLGCLDSRRARQALNQIAWRVGAPLLDAGVLSVDLLARVDRYDPLDAAGPCLECAWSDGDYAALEVAYPCDPDRARSAATGAPSSLGGLSASLLAIECQRILANVEGEPGNGGRQDDGTLEAGQRLVLSAAHHRLFTTRLGRNPGCRFDHETWTIEELGISIGELTLGELLTHAHSRLDQGAGEGLGPLRLSVHGLRFVPEGYCRRCDWTALTLQFVTGPDDLAEPCPACGGPFEAVDWGPVEWLHESEIAAGEHDRTLASMGIRPLDVVTAACTATGRELHLQMGPERSREVG